MSGMVIKSVTACVVSMAAAAGVTWFGTAPVAEAGEHPHRMSDKAKLDTSDSDHDDSDHADSKHAEGGMHAHDGGEMHSHDDVETTTRNSRDRAISKVVVTSEAERSPTRSAPPGITRDRSTTTSVIDRLMHGSDSKPADRPAYKHEGDKTVRIKRETVKDGDEKDVEVEVFVMDKEGAEKASKAFRDMVEADNLAMREGGVDADMQAELDRMISEMTGMADEMDRMGNAMSETLTPDAVMPTGVSPAAVMPDMTASSGLRPFRKAKPSELIETTESIEDSDLRDQALYAVTTYALRFDDFDAAKTAVSKIEQDDLRDTARSRMAIRHGELGHIDKALGVIEDLENEELRDIIRVQMIETLTTPVGKRGALPGY